MEFPSKSIEEAVNELSRLPGIGKKTALRLALHILKKEEQEAVSLGQAIISLRTNTRYCIQCNNISDLEVCNICASHKRDQGIICVVEDTRDVIAIENTGQFNGIYHVLGGIINPMEGIGPSQLHIEKLIERISNTGCKELIFAFSANMEGDTTAFYISRKVKNTGIKISSIARGIAVGSELEFTDEITLARSLLSRTEYHHPTEATRL